MARKGEKISPGEVWPVCKDTRPNCFRKKCGFCELLTTTYKWDGDCPFYKTRKRYKEDKKKYEKV